MTITQLKRQRSPHQPVGRWIRVEKRLALYLRDNFTCQICKRDLHSADPFAITLDHYTPKAHGGSNHESNLFTCCRSCNSSRQVSAFTKAQDRRVKLAMTIDLKPFKRLALSICDRDTYELAMARAKKVASRTLIATCTSCTFTTNVIGLSECPNCREAA